MDVLEEFWNVHLLIFLYACIPLICIIMGICVLCFPLSCKALCVSKSTL